MRPPLPSSSGLDVATSAGVSLSCVSTFLPLPLFSFTTDAGHVDANVASSIDVPFGPRGCNKLGIGRRRSGPLLYQVYCSDLRNAQPLGLVWTFDTDSLRGAARVPTRNWRTKTARHCLTRGTLGGSHFDMAVNLRASRELEQPLAELFHYRR